MAYTSQDIVNWLQQNPGLPDAVIAAKMQETGVTPEQVAAATGVNTADIQSRYTAAEPLADLYTSFQAGNVGTTQNLLDSMGLSTENLMSGFNLTPTDLASLREIGYKITPTDWEVQNWLGLNTGLSDADIRTNMDKFGVTPEQMARVTGIPLTDVQKRYDTAFTPTKQVTIDDLTGVISPTYQSYTGAAFRDLFPSFAKSQQLAAQRIANQPTTQQIVDMIQGSMPTNTISAASFKG